MLSVSTRGPGLPLVEVPAKSLEDYKLLVGEGKIQEIRNLALPLKGARVLHLNSTPYGGGVAELLSTLVPLMRDLGIQAEWRIIEGQEEFFEATKRLHNGLQGASLPLSESIKEIYLRYNHMNASRWVGMYDYVIVHDPQPLALKTFLQNPQGQWIWRCHIDLTTANPHYLEFIKPFIEEHQAAIFTMPQYVPEDLTIGEIAVIPPSIDPLSPKNLLMDPAQSRALVQNFGIDPDRPIMLQVGRFDPWKDPLGVIDAYRLAKTTIPELQLVMLSSLANDDPEGFKYFEKTARHAGEDPDIYLLSNLSGIDNIEVNAFQREADVVVLKSIREGFGLVVSEALWKERPVVGSRVGGIPIQIRDGESGYLIDSLEDCAKRVVELIRNPELAHQFGAKGREIVREQFLSTRHVRDYLRLFQRLGND